MKNTLDAVKKAIANHDAATQALAWTPQFDENKHERFEFILAMRRWAATERALRRAITCHTNAKASNQTRFALLPRSLRVAIG